MSGLKSLTLSLARGKTCQVLDPYLKLLWIHSQYFFNQPHSGRVLSFLTEDETERKLLNKGCWLLTPQFMQKAVKVKVSYFRGANS